eukprot:CAMPEP_0172703182 /NCGR_PEP_ID=MMETSP1074-20121228/37038_1 /TAXON_ID=2916 /ORGANISM="Ceratium fusus, Strain PA161109" /LENGTH=64 /DNA_ID=CAMNT_0013525045 /DNA_START=86 /DNA_END=278 /DNA_ORIENTATION=+
MMPGIFGRPTMEGNTARGASSPAKPALHIPLPLSTTKAATSSSSAMIKAAQVGGQQTLVHSTLE